MTDHSSNTIRHITGINSSNFLKKQQNLAHYLCILLLQLTKKPVNTRALSFFSAVAGEALTKHLTKILPALMLALGGKLGSECEAEELGYCQSVVLSVHDEVGMRTVIDELLQATNDKNAGLR